MNYELYVADCETSGLNHIEHSPIEISIYRFSTGEQKTWFLKPLNLETISNDALRINGHRIEDLRGFTAYGKELYKDPTKVLIEVENWLAEDNLPSDSRILVGQNIPFDKAMLMELWKKCGAEGSFPWNHKYSIDTMGIQFTIDLAQGKMAEGYSLKNLCKRYGVKNNKAHSSESDTIATMEVFKKQLDVLKKL